MTFPARAAAPAPIFWDALRALYVALALSVCAPPAPGQHAPATDAPAAEPPPIRVSSVIIRFRDEHPWNPDVALLADAPVTVGESGGVFYPPGDDMPRRTFALSQLPAIADPRFHESAIQSISDAVRDAVLAQGLMGVYVAPDPAQLRVVDGHAADFRPPGDTSLTLIVTIGRVTQVRSVGLGERLPSDQTVNNPLHARIVAASPVAPASGERRDSDLVRRRLIDDYGYFLNRHPGRRVDSAVAASEDEAGGVLLDYLITENRPWLLFAQASTTGSAGTSRWREHFGFIHNQLTNADDILTLGYLTANFEDVNLLYGSYERPFPGTPRLRWRLAGSWHDYVSSEFGLAADEFSGEGWDASAEVAWNFLQHRQLFLDLVAGAKFEHVSATNNIALVSGEDDFFKPAIALRLQRTREIDRTAAQVGLEFNIPGVATDSDNLDALGRFGAADDWFVLRAEASHSFYLDPLLFDSPDRRAGLVNELAFSARAQHALGNRLIPSETMTAGGLYSVRGYPESHVSGDNALVATAEYRFHLSQAIDPDASPGSLFGEPFRYRPQYQYGPTDWDLQLKAFVDFGRVTNTDRQAFESDSTLLGVGLGAELSITRRFNIRLDWGMALLDVEDAQGEKTIDAGRNEFYLVITGVF